MFVVEIATVVGIRIMVSMLFILLDTHFVLNHIELPRPGWKLEALKVLVTLVIAMPVLARMP